MKKLFFVVDTYGAPTQPYISALIDNLKGKTEVGGIFSVTKPVAESKEVVFLKQRPSMKSLLWAFRYYMKHYDYYVNKGNGSFLVKCIANLRPILVEENCILHVIHSQKAPLMMQLCPPNKYDYVVHFRGYDTNVRPFVDVVWRKELSDIYNNARALVFVSEALKQTAVQQLNAPSDKSYVSPGSVLVTLKKKRNQSNGICRFVTVGRMTWEKGYPFTLLALKQLLCKDKSFEYHIVGGGDDIKQVNYLVRTFQLEDNVKVHGFMKNDEAKELVVQCDVYMQCSVSEASPLSAKEAGMMGLPLIGTNIGGIPEIVKDGITGKLVEIGDINGLTNAMYNYMANHEVRKIHGENARKLCMEKYSINAESDRLINVYNSIDGNA